MNEGFSFFFVGFGCDSFGNKLVGSSIGELNSAASIIFFSAGFDSFRFIGKVPTHAGYWVLPSLFIFWGPVVGHC